MRSVALVGLLCLTWAAIACVPYLPTHDGPNHFASCVLSYRLDMPSSGLQSYLGHNLPLTTQGFQVPCRMLVSILEPFTALQVALAFLIMGFAVGFIYFATALQPATPWWPLGFAVAFSWPLYMGFFSFYAAVALSFWTLGLVLRLVGNKQSVGGWFTVAVLLLLAAYCHVFQAALCGLLALCISFVGAQAHLRVRTTVAVIVAGLPSFVLVVFVTVIFHEAGAAWGLSGAEPGHQTMGSALPLLPQLLVGGAGLRTWPPFLLILAAAAMTVWQFRCTSVFQRVLMVFGAIAFVVGLVSPMHLTHWSFFAPRLFLFPLLIAVAGAPAPPKRAQRRLLEAALIGAAVLHLGATVSANEKLYAAVKPDLAALHAPMSRHGPRLPIFLSQPETDFAFVEPGHGLGHLYLVAQGGVSPMVWAESRAIDPMIFVDEPLAMFGHPIVRNFAKSFDDALRLHGRVAQEVAIDVWAAWGINHDDVILSAQHGWPAERFVMRGYDVDFRGGQVTILRFRGCPLNVQVQATSEISGTVTVRAGVEGSGRAATGLAFDVRLRPGEVTPLPVARQLCGQGWVEVSLRSAGSSQSYYCSEFGGPRASFNLTKSPAQVLCSFATES